MNASKYSHGATNHEQWPPAGIKWYFHNDWCALAHGDCRDVLPTLAPVETVLTDPPYALTANKHGGTGKASLNLQSPAGRSRITTGGGFMGREWDAAIPGPEYWQAIARACKPGAMLLAFGGTRTHHRLMCAIEDAGWEIRDCVMWLYGSGFPKSHDISKALDTAAGAKRAVVGERQKVQSYGAGVNNVYGGGPNKDGIQRLTAPATDLARTWDGWGTALAPSYEPIILAQAPLDGTYAQNAERHGVAGLWIDGGRIPTDEALRAGTGILFSHQRDGTRPRPAPPAPNGRWPKNTLFDEQAAAMLDAQSGERPGASRFFYVAKAAPSERDGTTHPTVKPVTLLRYLCRLTRTPWGGTVLDPFCGSGSTLLAAHDEGRKAIGIEQDEATCEEAARRIEKRLQQPLL